jgi:hypothetical protein
MKANHKLAVVLLAGVSIGVAAAMAIQAQQVKTPTGYVVAEVEVTDPATMQKYGEKVPKTLAPQQQDPGSRRRTAQGRRCGHRFRQRGEGAGVVRLASLCGDQADPAKRGEEPHLHRRRPRPDR